MRIPSSFGGLVVLILLASACGPSSPTGTTNQSTASNGNAATTSAATTTTTSAMASKPPSTVAELAVYRGPDRQQILETGARQEGKVSWYTTLAGEVTQALPDAFQAKYPYLTVETFRADTTEVLTRITTETQAGQYLFDIADQSDVGLNSLREAKLLTPYYSPPTETYPGESVKLGSDGQVLWAYNSQTCSSFAYNTTLLPETAVPRTYKDLLNPELKGKMAVAGTSTGVNLVGNMVTHQGEDFFLEFAKQDVQIQMISGRALLDLVVNGEIPVSPTIYQSHTTQAVAKGAPLKWVALEPVTCASFGDGLSVKAPHPNAALLYIDFVLGPEGQKIIEGLAYNSPARDPGYQRWSPEAGFSSTADYDKAFSYWQKLLRTNLGRH